MKINENTYNYLVYTQLVKLLDPLTQLMIYYRQGDRKSFNRRKFNNYQRFLAMFLLGKKDGMKRYIDRSNMAKLHLYYFPFLKMIDEKSVTQHGLNEMLFQMADNGNFEGVKYFVEQGAHNEKALVASADNGYLDIVKYLIEKGHDPNVSGGAEIVRAANKGYLDIVKYLVEHELSSGSSD